MMKDNLKANNTMRKLISIVAIFVLVTGFALSSSGVFSFAGGEKDNSKIVIVHTNDVHCKIDKDTKDNKNAGYEGVAWLRNEMEKTYSNVSLIDSGDNIQGGNAGILSRGQEPIKLMNLLNYTVSAVGNHEFDYGVNALFDLTKDTEKLANYPYVSCNFKYLKEDGTVGDTVYDPYYIQTYDTSAGQKKVAFVGVTSPESLTKTPGDTFKDKTTGKYLYTFCEDKTGAMLYEAVQTAVDSAKTAGADYVVLLGHLGQDGVEPIWRSDTVVKNTNGIDVVLDGHSHEEYTPPQNVKNKDGKEILVVQNGTQLSRVGVLTIDVTNGAITEESKRASELGSDATVKAEVDRINAWIDEQLGIRVGESLVDLYAYEPNETEDIRDWAVRLHETNLGDLITDAYRSELKADVSLINGGGIRDDILKGDITYKTMKNVQPFDNDTAVILATGQQILDALEMGARKYPERNAAFMQVSGITYDLMKNVPSHVVTDDKGNFIRVDGEYRVQNVKINGEPIDLNKKYSVAGLSFTLLRQGDGLTMFAGCEVLVSCGPRDFELVASYVMNKLCGTIGTEYEGLYGQGRINITDKVDKKTVDTADDNDLALYSFVLLISIIGTSYAVRRRRG